MKYGSVDILVVGMTPPVLVWIMGVSAKKIMVIKSMSEGRGYSSGWERPLFSFIMFIIYND
jgi:hypothetical protein